MKIKTLIFYPVVFLAAFLLFQIEPIISKILLPKFGGSYLVWGGVRSILSSAVTSRVFLFPFYRKETGDFSLPLFSFIPFDRAFIPVPRTNAACNGRPPQYSDAGGYFRAIVHGDRPRFFCPFYHKHYYAKLAFCFRT
jgi:hypothetical protein